MAGTAHTLGFGELGVTPAHQLLNLVEVLPFPSLFAHLTMEPARVTSTQPGNGNSNPFTRRWKTERNAAGKAQLCSQPVFPKLQAFGSTFATFATLALEIFSFTFVP